MDPKLEILMNPTSPSSMKPFWMFLDWCIMRCGAPPTSITLEHDSWNHFIGLLTPAERYIETKADTLSVVLQHATHEVRVIRGPKGR